MNRENQKKISKNRQKKEQQVSDLSQKVAKAKGLVFANYQGMTHQQLEQLKKGLRSADAEIVVIKNTLLQRSLKDNNYDTPQFHGPTFILFAYNDVLLAFKELAKTIKAINLPVIKT